MEEKREKSLFDVTAKEIVESCQYEGFFSSDYKMLTREELDARGVHVKVTYDDRSDDEYITDELRARGYSGRYRLDSDGVITHVIPVDRFGLREDIGPLPRHIKFVLRAQAVAERIRRIF